MDVVSQWVTQIIVFLLLAAIIDLLVPITSMKKYIKLVIGLILMLIFLKPVFFLFSIDFQSELASSFDEVYEGKHNIEEIENLTKEQKIDIQASQAAYILEEMATQLTNVAEKPLLTDYHVVITNIDFIFSNEHVVSFENLEEVIVNLHESDGEEGMIRSIDEVIIQQGQSNQVVAEDQDEDIQLLLKDVWELHDKQITIKWEGGTS